MLLLVTFAVTITVLVIAVGGPDPPPSERKVERRLRAVSARAGFPLHSARCVRDEQLPRTFVCLIEGPYAWHLAWRVHWLAGAGLDIRAPDGTRVSF